MTNAKKNFTAFCLRMLLIASLICIMTTPAYAASKTAKNLTITSDKAISLSKKSTSSYTAKVKSSVGSFSLTAKIDKVGSDVTTKGTWTSSDKKLVSVSKKGLVTVKKSGTVTIKFRYNRKTTSIRLKVLKDTSWKKKCLNYIQTQVYDYSSHKFDLVYINNNDIPELHVIGMFTVEGDRLVSFEGKKPVVLTLNIVGLRYAEKTGLFCDTGGRMGEYYDTIYTMRDGKFKKTAEGKFFLPYDTSKEKDTYYWNNKEVTKDVYESKKAHYISKTPTFYDNKLSAQDLINRLSK